MNGSMKVSPGSFFQPKNKLKKSDGVTWFLCPIALEQVQFVVLVVIVHKVAICT